MYKTILVPLDETPFGEHALPWALAIAERTKASLHLVHVHSLLAPLYATNGWRPIWRWIPRFATKSAIIWTQWFTGFNTCLPCRCSFPFWRERLPTRLATGRPSLARTSSS